jgi:hypothetical protein
MSGADKGVLGVNWEILLKKTILCASGHIDRCIGGVPLVACCPAALT